MDRYKNIKLKKTLDEYTNWNNITKYKNAIPGLIVSSFNPAYHRSLKLRNKYNPVNQSFKVLSTACVFSHPEKYVGTRKDITIVCLKSTINKENDNLTNLEILKQIKKSPLIPLNFFQYEFRSHSDSKHYLLLLPINTIEHDIVFDFIYGDISLYKNLTYRDFILVKDIANIILSPEIYFIYPKTLEILSEIDAINVVKSREKVIKEI